MKRRAKIIATLGPSTNTPASIRDLYLAGVDVFRLNLSHGSHDEHKIHIHTIRSVEKEFAHPVTIMLDLQGPKLRIGRFAESEIHLIPGQTFALDTSTEAGTLDRVHFPHTDIFKALLPQSEILLNDGKIRLKIEDVDADHILTTVLVGGSLTDCKGVNIPNLSFPIPALTFKDREDLAFGLSEGVDWIALSFVQNATDVYEAKALIQGQAFVCSKIEKPQAIDHLDAIVEASDGILVARGDLGVEMHLEEVPCIQKKIIHKCRWAGKPVIVATQMLESMIHNPSPTRAETSDVATAIFEGVDGVMLSAESAIGDYPCEAVSMMDRIIQRTERDETYTRLMQETRPTPCQTTADAITASARKIAYTIQADVITAFSEKGTVALRMARERPSCPILCLTPNLSTARRMNLLWGTLPVVVPNIHNEIQMVELATNVIQTHTPDAQTLVIVAGIPFGASGLTNLIRVIDLS